ncbi:EpsG family protein [Brachymonas sp. J145]|uniref:EpsG family protein n=1 Tax=Brachymonas sp. J145 TaxID=3116489 RepID=UPI002E78162A|nr:EpsG family protein [Brachymonas sp. J145]MEE1653409.1 EpsG family protein [Brachymonas sp. J145]
MQSLTISKSKQSDIRVLARIFLAILIALLYVLKYEGNDYFMYEEHYYSDGTFEFGYELLASTAKFLGLEFKYFYIAYSSFNLFLLFTLTRWKFRTTLLALIPLMLFPGLPLNTIRQFTASLICAIAYDRHYPNENKKYILGIILAMQFHVTALLFLIPLAWKRTKIFLLILVTSIIAFVALDAYTGLILQKIIFYTEGGAHEGFYEQSGTKSIAFVVLFFSLIISGFPLKIGDYEKYRPVILLSSIALLASAYMSIYLRFLYLFLPTIGIWLSSHQKFSKQYILPLAWILSMINVYMVVAIWSGDAYRHRNYLIDFFL